MGTVHEQNVAGLQAIEYLQVALLKRLPDYLVAETVDLGPRMRIDRNDFCMQSVIFDGAASHFRGISGTDLHIQRWLSSRHESVNGKCVQSVQPIVKPRGLGRFPGLAQ